MVTKQCSFTNPRSKRSVLAKILMVTKLFGIGKYVAFGSVLAKILMVTKPDKAIDIIVFCSVLAKILMVTKQ